MHDIPKICSSKYEILDVHRFVIVLSAKHIIFRLYNRHQAQSNQRHDITRVYAYAWNRETEPGESNGIHNLNYTLMTYTFPSSMAYDSIQWLTEYMHGCLHNACTELLRMPCAVAPRHIMPNWPKWCYEMEEFFAQLVFYEGNPVATDWLPSQMVSNEELWCFIDVRPDLLVNAPWNHMWSDTN